MSFPIEFPASLRLRASVPVLVAGLLLWSLADAADVPQLKSLYYIGAQRADYIMVVDVSATMAPLWPAVSGSIADFVDAIPEGDHVSVILFEGLATNSSILPRTVDARARHDLRDELTRQPTPRGLNTDFGYALDRVAQEIARPEASSLQFVFFFSDFVHEPLGTSPYQDRAGSSEPWVGLRKRCRLSSDGKAVQSFALMLPLSSRVGRDVALIESALGNLESVVVNRHTLKEWFNRRRAEIDRDKIRALVAQDLHRGWSVDVGTDRDGDLIVVRSAMQGMPVSVSVSGITASGLSVRCQAASTADLAPGGTVSVPFLLVREAPSWPARLLTTERVRTARVTLDISGEVQLQPSSELATLAIDPERPFGLERTVDARVLILGTPLWAQAALLAVALGFCLFAWKTWLKPAAPVSGSFRRILLDGASFHEELVIPRGTARRVIVGNVVDADVKSRLEGAVLAFAIHSRKPIFPLLGPKRGLYVYAQQGSDLFYAGRRYDREQGTWTEVDLPLRASPQQSVPANYRTVLAMARGGERISIGFARS